jgi:ribosome-associated heat shock protein Hsp15
MRFDVVLGELHLFKSRTQASVAIQDGSALLNGARVKPSHAVGPGDRITLIGTRGSRTLELLELPTRSLSKEAAKAMVREVAG